MRLIQQKHQDFGFIQLHPDINKDVFTTDNKWRNLEQLYWDLILMLWNEEWSQSSQAEAEGGLHN